MNCFLCQLNNTSGECRVQYRAGTLSGGKMIGKIGGGGGYKVSRVKLSIQIYLMAHLDAVM